MTIPIHATGRTTIVRLSLRDPSPDNSDGNQYGDQYEDVDLGLLTPRARALAEAVAQSSLRTRTKVLMDSTAGERMVWSGWASYPADSSVTPIDYLETEARKIPSGWHVYGIGVGQPVPSLAEAAADLHLTRDAARSRLGLSPAGWDTLRRIKHLPEPDRYAGRQPEWLPATIDAYATRPYELWTVSQIATYLGYQGPNAQTSARTQMQRWGFLPEDRLPGRSGESRYAGDQVQAAHEARQGSGRHDAKRVNGKFA